MKTIKFLAMTVAFAGMTVLNSCSKGDTGPTGPAGTNGTNGSANVTATTFTITPGSWSSVSGGYEVNLSVPSLTDVNSDEVSVSVSENSGTYLGLPATNLISNGDQLEFGYENSEVNILYIYSSAPSVSLVFKVVTIPPAQADQHPISYWTHYNENNQ